MFRLIFKHLITIALLLAVLAAAARSLSMETPRLIPVEQLPHEKAFYNESKGSYFDLVYVYKARTLWGIPLYSAHKKGFFALYYEKDLTLEQLNSRQLLSLLAKNNLPTPKTFYVKTQDRFAFIIWLILSVGFGSLIFLGYLHRLVKVRVTKKNQVYTGYLQRKKRPPRFKIK